MTTMGDVDSTVLKAMGLDPKVTKMMCHGGSTFSSAFKISTTVDGKEKNYFLKLGSGASELSVKGEYTSLNAIRSVVPNLCPKAHVYGTTAESEDRYFLVTDFLELGSSHPGGSGESLAQKLAKLHTTPAPIPEGFEKPMFGFPVSTCCGSTPQDNSWKSSWADFFANNRLRAIMKEGQDANGPDPVLARAVEKTASKVVPRLIGDDHIKGVYPVLVHGDLWSGNHDRGRIAGQGGDEEVIFDPAAVYGHSEYELGIMRMFGGFGSSFWEEYDTLVPKAEPEHESEDRALLYELYHHLNHWALFGGVGSYRETALRYAQLLNKTFGR
ncbi:fructosamine kinase [Jackrogersella minutella]|nr:fructosamine kinase [Jackrogersella minutella]